MSRFPPRARRASALRPKDRRRRSLACARTRHPARSRCRTRGNRRRRSCALPHQHGEGHHEPGLVGEAHVPVSGTQAVGDGAAARGKYDLRLAAKIGQEPEVADPHPVPESRAQRLRDRLLGREPHGEKSGRAAAGIEQPTLLGHQQAIHELLAEALVRRLDALDLDEVGADSKYHARRAPTMSRFISATAGPNPLMTARETMAWPMLSSTSSGIEATGCTL